MTKISIELGVSERSRNLSCDLEDLNLTEDQWDSMTYEAKEQCVQEWVDGLSDQPCWVVDSFNG